MSKNIRRVLCYTLTLLLFATISVMAQTQSTLCENHTEHTEDCGYVEAQVEVACDMECTDTVNGEVVHKEDCAYTEAVEESECTHSCELCDPELASTLSTDSTAEEEDVAQEADEAETTTEDATTEDAADATDESDEAADESDEADASEAADEAEDEADSSDEATDEDEDATDDAATTDEDSAATLSSSDIQTLDSSTYAINLTLTNTELTDEQRTINLVSETTGTLSVSVDLPRGETGRYIDVYLTDYGMTLSSTLPAADGNITSVESRTTTVELAMALPTPCPI